MQNPHKVAHFYLHTYYAYWPTVYVSSLKTVITIKTVIPGAEAEAVCALPTRYTRQLCTAITLASLTAPVPLWKMPHFIHSDITGWCSSGLSGFLHRNWICGTLTTPTSLLTTSVGTFQWLVVFTECLCYHSFTVMKTPSPFIPHTAHSLVHQPRTVLHFVATKLPNA